MLCRRPYMLGTLPCPCGGCLPCRINRRRVWTHRIILESFKHADSCFVTLTYDEAHVPSSLVKSDYQNWIKRLRRLLAPKKIRYFLAGEYGSDSGRPHFHAAIFGLDRYAAGGMDGRSGLVQNTWRDPLGASLGYTFVGDLTLASAGYIAGYLTKKLNEKSIREFSRMSLRPGIGADAVADIGRSLISAGALDVRLADVPTSLRHNGKMLPLGRYLRRRLRMFLGGSGDTPPDVSQMYALQQEAEKRETRAAFAKQGFKSWEAQKVMLDTYLQKINNLESRFNVRDSKRRKLR